MEIMHLRIGQKAYSYGTVFLNSNELEISFFDGTQKLKTLQAKILSHDPTTGFLSFCIANKVFQVIVSSQEQIISVQHRTAHMAILCKKIHPEPGTALGFFNTSTLSSEKNTDLTSPLSGRITHIYLKEGDFVKKGAPILIIESMKMENVLYASHDAVIKNVFIAIGDLVQQNQRLIGFKRSGEVYGATQATRNL